MLSSADRECCYWPKQYKCCVAVIYVVAVRLCVILPFSSSTSCTVWSRRLASPSNFSAIGKRRSSSHWIRCATLSHQSSLITSSVWLVLHISCYVVFFVSFLGHIVLLHTYVRPVVTDRVPWSICRSVTVVSLAKTAQPIEILFGLRNRMGPRNCIRWRFISPHEKGKFWGGAHHCKL